MGKLKRQNSSHYYLNEEQIEMNDYPPSTAFSKKKIINKKILLVFIFVTLLLFIIGIVLITIANIKLNQCENDNNINALKKLTSIDACGYSNEAKRVKLGDFLLKVRKRYHVVFPEETAWNPDSDDVFLRKNFKVHDPKPANIKKITEEALGLLDEAKNLNPDFSLMKPREHKSYLRVVHFLENIFANPSLNYYTGLWMLGPSSFCLEPICFIGYSLFNAVGSMTPFNEDDVELIIFHFKAFKQTIKDYIEVLKMGIDKGMVRTEIEFRAGIDAIKEKHLNVSQNGPKGISGEWYVSKFYNPLFYQNISNLLNYKYTRIYNKNVSVYIQDAIDEFIGSSVHDLLLYLEEHYLYCRPDNVGGAGLSGLPINVVYYKGVPISNRTTNSTLPLCTGSKCSLNGSAAYAMILGHYTTKQIHPADVYKMGWDNFNKLYPQVVEIAQDSTGIKNATEAVEKFKIRLLDLKENYFHDRPLPENETRGDAFKLCATVETAKINCPTRWKAMLKWFEFAQMSMSIHSPNTVDMFYFTGDLQSTPNCPVKLRPDFNPSHGGQSYDSSDADCSMPCNYNIPFFLENLGPKFSEYSVTAHESRPGHHTQVQGQNELFRDKCGGPEGWLDDQTYYTAFVEGWALYAENPLIAQGTDVYKDNSMQRYGMLKWQLWRALRLIVDTGIHYHGMTRKEALKLFEVYAWDKTDLSRKEVTRYQSNPGQATSYMIGQQDIWQLRNITEEKLGLEYDIKEFHLQALSQGSSPLAYLQSYIKKYIECKISPKKQYCNIVLNPTLASGYGKPFQRKKHLKYPLHRHYI